MDDHEFPPRYQGIPLHTLDADEILADVTPGPWVDMGDCLAMQVDECTCGGSRLYPHEPYCGIEGPLSQHMRPEDAKFCAQARTLVPALLAALRHCHTGEGLLDLISERLNSGDTKNDASARDENTTTATLLAMVSRQQDALHRVRDHLRELSEVASSLPPEDRSALQEIVASLYVAVETRPETVPY